jgi:hypothetical protein
MKIIQAPLFDRNLIVSSIGDTKVPLARILQDNQKLGIDIIKNFFGDLYTYSNSYFRERTALLLGFCTVRHNTIQKTEHHPLHTDDAFFPPNGTGLTFWCPLDYVGHKSPGITFVCDGTEITPSIGPGQAVVIPTNLPHKTQSISGERASIEFRCSPYNTLPNNIGPSPIATKRKYMNNPGILIEIENNPVLFFKLDHEP